MTWPPITFTLHLSHLADALIQSDLSPDLNPIEMVWDELVRRVKEKQYSTSICGNSFKTFGKTFQMKLVERMPSVSQAVIKAKDGYFEDIKYILICLINTFLVTT
jgi:hypothetical protein